MSELALYRKYRPGKFEDVIGQDHIVKVLQGALKQGNIAHAYLLVGSRGLGKTTIARIIATEIGTSGNDIYEMDAASNRGVDDIRELREGVRTLPFDSKYKVYIIDEVHMLTKEAWAALLKTLEEPPAHVVFVLATTDLDKVPDTIVSRCQTFQFKKPTDAILEGMIKNVAKEEGFTIEDGGGELIALLGDGSFRDTLSILQKVISYSPDPSLEKGRASKKISRKEIEEVTGAPSGSRVQELIGALIATDSDKALGVVKSTADEGIDMVIFTKLLVNKLRTLLLLRFAPEMRRHIEADISESDREMFGEFLKEKKGIISSKTLLVMLECLDQTPRAFIPSLPLELALIKILGQDKSVE